MIRFRQIKGADSGREFEFDQDLVRIGRMPDSDVNFDPEVDLDASGRHAEIRNEDGRYLLIDTGSRNGTWLNGQRIKHAALGTGDEIEFGRGGPTLKIESMEARPSDRPFSRVRIDSHVPLREPRFDPMAMPVTTATRLDDLVAGRELLGESLRAFEGPRHALRNRWWQRSSAVLWGAAGVVLLAAIAFVLGASLR